MWSNIRIGLIGKGSQYKRVSKILKSRGLGYFIYKPEVKKKNNKDNLENLKKCNVIFILSPNKTHFKYLKILSKGRYIFCEKPPVSNMGDLTKLKKLNYRKIYFNFNFRFSCISQVLSEIKIYNLGQLLYGTITSGHGLGFKKNYVDSWRSNKKLCKKGVFEIISIHWIDLINIYFSLDKIKMLKLMNFSKKGSSYDNSYCKIALKNNSEIDIFSSYTSPLVKKILLIFNNGTIEQNNNSIEIRGPAINLDKKNISKNQI